MSKDFHDEPFDDGTILKLEIFESYVQEWIPTFLYNKVHTNIYIFDFMCGPGYDAKQIPGSPVRIFNKIINYKKDILKTKTKVNLILNDLDEEKTRKLKESLVLENNKYPELNDFVKIRIYNEDFSQCFKNNLKLIEKNPSLVIIDQKGVKFITQKYFLTLANFQKTDFLYYVTTHTIRRFAKSKSFMELFDVDFENVINNNYKFIHIEFLNELKKWLPENNDLKLYPFSIKKNNNIYGIIFGAKHVLAVDKFLNIACKKNEINGIANYDIDDDQIKKQYPEDLFGNTLLTKVEKFQHGLENLLRSKKLLTNKDVYDYTLENGHVTEHSIEVLKNLKKAGILYFKFPYLNYGNVYKQKRIINYHKHKRGS